MRAYLVVKVYLWYILSMAKTQGLSREQVEHVAKLASLPLSSKETALLAGQLSEVVSYVGKISEVEVGKVKKILKAVNVTRKDEIQVDRCLSQQEAVSQAKKVYNGLFVVPGILEEF